MQKIVLESIESCILSPTYHKALGISDNFYPEVRCGFELSMHMENDTDMNTRLVIKFTNNSWLDPEDKVRYRDLTAIAEFSREDALYLRNYLDAFLEATK